MVTYEDSNREKTEMIKMIPLENAIIIVRRHMTKKQKNNLRNEERKVLGVHTSYLASTMQAQTEIVVSIVWLHMRIQTEKKLEKEKEKCCICIPPHFEV